MAIFEKTSQSKTVVDDTEKLICTVENAQNINKYTEYILRVQRGPSSENSWHVSRRYRDFAALHSSLQPANIALPLPPKKLIGNMQPSFIAERQIALQEYINEVLKHQILELSLQIRNFLDPLNYPSSLADQALQSVSIALRGDGQYELKGPVPDIGWRIRKHYFLVNDTENNANCLLSWLNYGPDRYLADKDLQAAFKSLQNLSHPYIDPILTIHNLDSGAYVVRRIHENGSIRDILYGTEYSKNYLLKYGNPKIRKPFTMGQIAHYALQILEALKFLHDKGLAHGHLHPGNIAIEDQRVLLLDLENILIGVSSLHRPKLVRLRNCSAEAVDVYSFGLTLYEMAFGEPMTEHYCDADLVGIPKEIETVLRMCLSSESCKRGFPSISEVQQTLLVFRGRETPVERPHLKFPLALKDAVSQALANTYARLKADQKLVRSTKREVRIREILNSEEELRKHKRRAKKRDSVWKSTSSLAETVRSHSESTASSPTPPSLPAESSRNGTRANGRAALLDAICSFDKTRLSRTDSH